jgi:hypothetical protein
VSTGDGALNVWAVGWVGHALVQHRRGFSTPTSFYPKSARSPFSEAMLVQGALCRAGHGARARSPCLPTTSRRSRLRADGWTFCLLVRRWTGSWSAGYVAGSLAAFNAFTLVHLTHLQFLHASSSR